jgi:hypothetical protein
MQSLKVRKTGITADAAAEVIKRGLGDAYTVQVDAGTGEIKVRKGLAWASVTLYEEGGATTFETRGKGFMFLMIMINNAGIAKRTSEVIGQAAEYRDDS